MQEYLNKHINLAEAMKIKARSLSTNTENISRMLFDGVEQHYIRNNLEYVIANANEILSIAHELSDCLDFE